MPTTPEDVRKIALALPGTSEIDHWNRPAWRTTKRIFAVMRAGRELYLHLPDASATNSCGSRPDPGTFLVKYLWGKDLQRDRAAFPQGIREGARSAAARGLGILCPAAAEGTEAEARQAEETQLRSAQYSAAASAGMDLDMDLLTGMQEVPYEQHVVARAAIGHAFARLRALPVEHDLVGFAVRRGEDHRGIPVLARMSQGRIEMADAHRDAGTVVLDGAGLDNAAGTVRVQGPRASHQPHAAWARDPALFGLGAAIGVAPSAGHPLNVR